MYALLLLVCLADTPAPPLADSATAVLVGPSSVAPGAYIRIKITGTIGDDPKLTVVPAVKDMDLVTFADGTYGITAELVDSGTYTFFLGVNKGGKTSIATLVVVVKQPDPPPVPDSTVVTLTESLKTDAAPADRKAALVSLYKQMATQKVSTLKELAALLSTTSKGLFKDTELAATRAAVTTILEEKFGTKQGALDPKLQEATFTAIANVIANIP